MSSLATVPVVVVAAAVDTGNVADRGDDGNEVGGDDIGDNGRGGGGSSGNGGSCSPSLPIPSMV
jgi:hypothetical protein